MPMVIQDAEIVIRFGLDEDGDEFISLEFSDGLSPFRALGALEFGADAVKEDLRGARTDWEPGDDPEPDEPEL